MLTRKQMVAKLAARQLCTYAARLTAERKGLQDTELPRLQPGIAGFGIATHAVRVYTLPNAPDNLQIPDHLAGLPTERVSTTGFRLHAPLRQTSLSPTPCGVSIGHYNITVGTLGCLVDIAGERYILSNNHVLADSNAGKPNDDILQPGNADAPASNPARRIASLANYEAIDFAGNDNHIDAAIAKPDDPASVTPNIMTIGLASNPPLPAVLGQPVAKHGRTTGFTWGTVVDISFDGYVNFGTPASPRLAWFEDQIGIEGAPGTRFSAGGDSGSLIVDRPGSHPVGLLFAGDDTQTLANPINLVLNRFGATVVSI